MTPFLRISIDKVLRKVYNIKNIKFEIAKI